MAWLLLTAAGLLEIVFALSMKYADGFTRALPVGSGYAVWTGIGAAGTAIFGMALLGDPASPVRIGCLLLILAGVLGLRLFS